MAVTRLLASRLRALTLMIEDLSLRGALARVAKLLLDCTRGHQTLAGGEGGACARLTQHQIAAMTGSVREVVQRALMALERDGAIRLERARVMVMDPNALERWSDAEAAGSTRGSRLLLARSQGRGCPGATGGERLVLASVHFAGP